MSLTLEQFGIDRLDPRQRFELIGLIWDSIPDDEPFVPPEWHLRELERRDRSRLARECANLDPKEEQQLAEEDFAKRSKTD